jgi:hypothetical protein
MISYYNTEALSSLVQAVTLLICIPDVSGLSLAKTHLLIAVLKYKEDVNDCSC